MSLLNRGAHTHYSSQERKDDFQVDKFAELTAYIRETLKTAVSAIDAMKSQVVANVTATVRGKLTTLENTIAGLQDDADTIVADMEQRREEIIDSAISDVSARLDNVVQQLEDEAKEELTNEFSDIRAEYVQDVKNEVVTGVKAEVNSTLAEGISAIDSAVTEGVDTINTQCATLENTAIDSINSVKNAGLASLRTEKTYIIGELGTAKTSAVDAVTNAVNAGKTELDDHADEIIAGVGVRGHDYTSGNVWETGNTREGASIMGTFVVGSLIASMTSTEILNAVPSGADIVDWKFWRFDGANTDYTFDPVSMVVTKGTASGAINNFYLEILYIEG